MNKEEFENVITGLSCEDCSNCINHEDIGENSGHEMYYYFDLGGWTRIYCEKHIPKTNEGKLCYGAKPLKILLIKENK